MRIPPNLSVNLDESVRDFWKRRLDTHTHDYYRGRVLAKMPEDLRTYWHVLEASLPEVVVEIGSYQGGGATWFADQLDILLPGLPRPTVISVDQNHIDYKGDPRIAFVHGHVGAVHVVDQVHALVADRRAMVSEDSGHTLQTTRAALRGYHDLVSKGCWFVVEDGVVDDDDLRLPRYPRGVQPAIVEFLATEEGKRFSRHWLAPYGVTTCIGGWLEAVA